MSLPFPAAELAAAEAEEAYQRNADFLGLPETICGLDVCPLTLRHVAVLEAIRSPFLCGGVPTANDIVNFLWLLNPKFTPSKMDKRWFYLWHCRKLNAIEAVKGIEKFMNHTFADAIGGGVSRKRFFSRSGWWVFFMGHECGWNKEQVMTEPIRCLIQYSNAAAKHHNPSAVLFNPSEAIVGRWLRAKDSQPQRN